MKKLLDGMKKLNNKYVKIIIWIIFVLGVLFTLKRFYVDVLTVDYNTGNEDAPGVVLADGSVKQYFSTEGDISNVDILASNDSKEDANVKITLCDGDTDEAITSTSIVIPISEERGQVHVDMTTSGIENDTWVYFLIESDGTGNPVLAVEEDNYVEQLLYQNDVKTSYRMRMSVAYGTQKYIGAFCGTAMLFIIIGAFLLFPIKNHKYTVANMFLLIALTGGITLACINPAGQECDGRLHMMRSFDVSYGNLLGGFVVLNHDGELLEIPDNMDSVNLQPVPADTNSGSYYVQCLREKTYSDTTILVNGSTGFGVIFYYPQALGIAIARILGVNMYWTMAMAHMMNLIVYALITYLALRLMPVYKLSMALIALLPVTLFQSASTSPDGLLHALCFLFISLCFYYAYGEKKTLKWKDVLILGIILTLLLMCKIVYVALGILVFIIPIKKFKSRKAYIIAFVIALIPVMALGIYTASSMLAPTSAISQTAGGLGMTQMQYVMHNPLSFVKVMVMTMITYFTKYMEMLSTVGWMSYTIMPLFYVVPIFFVVVSILDNSEIATVATCGRKDRVIWGLCIIATIILMYFGMYIGNPTNNPVGAPNVLGIQGRYFVPILPLCGALLCSKRVKNEIGHFQEKVMAGAGLIILFTIVYWMHSFY